MYRTGQKNEILNS